MRRLRTFRLAILILIPALVVGALEIGLRLGGYGTDTGYLLQEEIGGEVRNHNNPRFFELFFPEHLLPVALPFAIEPQKPPEELRVLLLGGSAAMGIPEAAYGMGPILEELLRSRLAGVDVRVMNLASTAINSHVVRRIAHSIDTLEPDLIVVYLGNNEVVGPFGAGTVFTPLAPPLRLIRPSVALKSTRTGQLLSDLWGRIGSKPELPARWRGMEMFIQQRVPPDDPGLQQVYRNFEANLEDICGVGERLGVPVVLSTVAVNLRDCAPFGSEHDETLTRDERDRWDSFVARADSFQRRGDYAGALVEYDRALEIDPLAADVHYRRGRCLLELEDPRAGAALSEALERDTLRFRADARIDRIIREVAARGKDRGVRLADARARVAGAAPAGLPGAESLYEHADLNFDGNYLVASTLEDAVLEELPAPWFGREQSADRLSRAECARRLAFTPFNDWEIQRQVRSMLERPPFTAQSDRGQQIDRIEQRLRELSPALEPDSLRAQWGIYAKALQRRPERWILRYRAASFLKDALGDAEASEPMWRQLVSELPHFPAAKNSLAKALADQGQWGRARELLEESLALEPHQPEMVRNLAQAVLQSGMSDPAAHREALRLHEQAHLMDRSPLSLRQLNQFRNAEARWWMRAGRPGEAVVLLEQALADDPDYLDAHFNLSTLLLDRGERERAIEHLREVLRLDPEHEPARARMEQPGLGAQRNDRR
jgi:tetratricopeptide (TPR) repeat protein